MNNTEFNNGDKPKGENKSNATENRLIEREPSRSLRVAVVVPVYSEYGNGNIFRLIESFTKQTASPQEYEIILLVNNSPGVAILKTRPFVENQQTLALDGFLNGKKELPEGLNDYRKNVLVRAKEKGIVIHLVDLSSIGVEKKLGKIRDRGLQEAIQRFYKNGLGPEGVIAQLDADTVVEHTYVQKLLQHFSDPEVESLFVNLDYYIPEGSEELFKTSFYHQYKIAFDQWVNTVLSRDVKVGGPQTIAKVKAYEKIGGIVHTDIGEDFELSKAASIHTKYQFAPDIKAYTSDRARTVGYDSERRLEELNEPEYNSRDDIAYFLPRILFFEHELMSYLITNPETIPSESELKPFFDKYGLPFDYNKFREMVFEVSSINAQGLERSLERKVSIYTTDYFKTLNIQITAKSKEYVGDIIKLFHTLLSPSEIALMEELLRQSNLRSKIIFDMSNQAITEAIKLVFQKGSVSPSDFIHNPKDQEFLNRNPWIIERVNNLRGLFKSPSEAIAILETEIPEWIGNYENSRLRIATATLQAITQFLRTVRNSPEKYTKANDFLKNLKRYI